VSRACIFLDKYRSFLANVASFFAFLGFSKYVYIVRGPVSKGCFGWYAFRVCVLLDEYRFFLEYLASFSAYLTYNENVYIVIEPLFVGLY